MVVILIVLHRFLAMEVTKMIHALQELLLMALNV
jgi:hypothetical protein